MSFKKQDNLFQAQVGDPVVKANEERLVLWLLLLGPYSAPEQPDAAPGGRPGEAGLLVRFLQSIHL